jgi:hypothetical protein
MTPGQVLFAVFYAVMLVYLNAKLGQIAEELRRANNKGA